MTKLIKYDSEAKTSINAGVDKLANAVKVTLGPKGRNVIIEKNFGAPVVTKDGVTVAKEIELEDNIENMWEGDDAPLILNSISVEDYDKISKAKII